MSMVPSTLIVVLSLNQLNWSMNSTNIRFILLKSIDLMEIVMLSEPQRILKITVYGGGSLQFKIHIKLFKGKTIKISLSKMNIGVSILMKIFNSETTKLHK